jgi:hypothetical protein
MIAESKTAAVSAKMIAIASASNPIILIAAGLGFTYYYFHDKNNKLPDAVSVGGTLTEKQITTPTSNSPPSANNKQSCVIHECPVFEDSQQKMSLVLVFGKSFLDSLVKIKEEQKITDGDYELLVNGMEWYWFGVSPNVLDIPDDATGNMCWLRFDFPSLERTDIKNQCRLALKELIKEIKDTSAKINSGGYFQYKILSDIGFTKL